MIIINCDVHADSYTHILPHLTSNLEAVCPDEKKIITVCGSDETRVVTNNNVTQFFSKQPYFALSYIGVLQSNVNYLPTSNEPCLILQGKEWLMPTFTDHFNSLKTKMSASNIDVYYPANCRCQGIVMTTVNNVKDYHYNNSTSNLNIGDSIVVDGKSVSVISKIQSNSPLTDGQMVIVKDRLMRYEDNANSSNILAHIGTEDLPSKVHFVGQTYAEVNTIGTEFARFGIVDIIVLKPTESSIIVINPVIYNKRSAKAPPIGSQ